MWTLNGEATLPKVLGQIDKAIPCEVVGQRIAVDDGSTDRTVEVLVGHGWQVFKNRGKGICDGANTALGLVWTRLFVSFEQDVLVSSRWWCEVFPLIRQSAVAVASGLRLPSDPVLRKLGECWAEKHFHSSNDRDFKLGMTLDNTVYRTDVLKSLGGFPRGHGNVGIDLALFARLRALGLRWAVNKDVVSVHIRKGIRDELRHQEWYARNWRFSSKVSRFNVFLRFAYSLFSAFPVVLKTREPRIFLVYPAIRFCFLRGVLKS